MTTDAEGRIRFNGFLGDYEITSGDNKATFQLAQKGEATLEVRLAR